MNRQILDYFKKGFALTNKSWDLFAIGLLLSLLLSIPDLLGNFSGAWILQILGFLLFFITMGFSFSTAVFLSGKQEGGPIGFSKILSTTMSNAKRLIFPFSLIFILLVILGVVSVGIIFAVYGEKADFAQIAQGFDRWKLLATVFVGLFSFTTFTSVYFSIEKIGFFKSIKKSISFSFQNLDFMLVVYVATVIIDAINSSFFSNNQIWYQAFVQNIIYQYSGLVITATSLILYQNRKNLKV